MHNKLNSPRVANAERDDDISAAIYARTSSQSQQFGYSLDEQVRQCLERCKMLDWQPTFIFRDSVESGKDTQRPAFQSMMDKAETGLFNVILIWALDRFSRSLHHAVRLEADLRQMDVALHSITEQIDTTTPSGRFNFQNIASAAEFEREHIKQRAKMGQRALALQGKWPNDTPPLGYKLTEEGRLTIDGTESGIVLQIFNRYIEVESMPVVASELNEESVTTKKGNEWTARKIRDVLTNQIYIGEYEVADVEKEMPECLIVDEEIFDTAKETRTRFKREKRQSREEMEKQRKRALVEGVIEQYDDFVEKNP
jgi:site-specific DNA recombinase